MLGIDVASDAGSKWIQIAQNKGFSGAAHRRALDPPGEDLLQEIGPGDAVGPDGFEVGVPSRRLSTRA